MASRKMEGEDMDDVNKKLDAIMELLTKKA